MPLDPNSVKDEVPIYKCWWTYTGKGCSLVNPNSDFLDFNTYGWLYIAGGVLVLFAIVALFYGLGKASSSSTKTFTTFEEV